jgi:hypothetical protein
MTTLVAVPIPGSSSSSLWLPQRVPRNPSDTLLAHREALPFAKLTAIKNMTASRSSLRVAVSRERAAFLASSMLRRS